MIYLQVRGRHFASHDIRDGLEELKRLYEELKIEADRRGKLLQEAVSIHTFVTEVLLLRVGQFQKCYVRFKISNNFT